jgi:hypothetical protein
MATPIKETPVLRGKYADNFLKEIRKNETDVSAHLADCRRARVVYAAMQGKRGFHF